MFVKPWNKEAERILKQLSMNGRAYIKNNPQLPREFGMKCKEIINNNFLDIATIRNKKERRTWFITPPDTMVISKFSKRGPYYFFKKL